MKDLVLSSNNLSAAFVDIGYKAELTNLLFLTLNDLFFYPFSLCILIFCLVVQSLEDRTKGHHLAAASLSSNNRMEGALTKLIFRGLLPSMCLTSFPSLHLRV